MSGLEIAGVLIGLSSLVLLLLNYKRLRERILKINLPEPTDPIMRGNLPVGAKARYENLSDYNIPKVEIEVKGFIGDLNIFNAKSTISFDAHDSLDATIDLSKRLEERGLLSMEEIKARRLKISIECNYSQIILWNRIFLFKQRIYRRYIWDTDIGWRHPYDNEWP